MTAYEKFRHCRIDFSVLGLTVNETNCPYFCTPRGARIIAWAGVDGIHYCFIRGFGTMVFSVNPENPPGGCVHPIARSFEELLQLLLACGGMAVIEQAHGLSEAAFEAELWENQPDAVQRAALDALREQFSIAPMQKPFQYLRQLQQAFDYSSIPFTEAYYDPDMNPAMQQRERPWKVYFHSFFGCTGQGRPGKELSIFRQFDWGPERWHVPAAYACSEGLVLDFCAEISPAPLEAFLGRWEAVGGNGRRLTHAERSQLEMENPLSIDFTAALTLNGKRLHSKHGCGIGWIPSDCLPAGVENPPEAGELLAHYGLDPAKGWLIRRISFPWVTKTKPKFHAFTLQMEIRPASIPGPCFEMPGLQAPVRFSHPITGVEHTLTVLEYEAQKLDKSHFPDNDMEYPLYCTAISYAVFPALSADVFQIQDCAEGDQPRRKQPPAPGAPEVHNDVVVFGLVRTKSPSADGTRPRCAFSSLHFEPVERVHWRILFREKLRQDAVIDLTIDNET